LRPWIKGEPLEITIIANDQLGNPKMDPAEDESAQFSLSISRCGATLPVSQCGTPLTALTWRLSDNAFAEVGEVFKSAVPGQYKVGQRSLTPGCMQCNPTLAFRTFQLLKLKYE